MIDNYISIWMKDFETNFNLIGCLYRFYLSRKRILFASSVK